MISPFIYRIHEDPNEEKLSDLKNLPSSYGLRMGKNKEKTNFFSLNEVMKKAKEKKASFNLSNDYSIDVKGSL